jgi:hypothetical protein
VKIALSPYQANIEPQKSSQDHLWCCIIRREGSPDVLARHGATNKEDACCAALLELARLAGYNPGSALQSLPRL